MDITKQVSIMQTELQALRLKSASDDNTIGLLKEQYESLSGDFAQAQRKNDLELQKLRQERDLATRSDHEISTILDNAAQMIVTGLRRRKGDEIPAFLPDRNAVVSRDLLPRVRPVVPDGPTTGPSTDVEGNLAEMTRRLER